MGSAIAQRLASLGHEMMVWNRSADKARSLGLPVAATPQALASACEMVISILTDANAVDQVYGEMLKADVKGKLFIEMSTVRPDVQKALSQKVLSRGARLVECPVGGTIGPAKEGKLFGFAGGDQVVPGKSLLRFAWAVHPGDVELVPLPATAWLFVTGLLGLLARTTRRARPVG